MKKALLLLTIVSCTLIISSCKKDKAEDPVPPVPVSTPGISAKVAGTSKSWSVCTYVANGGTSIYGWNGSTPELTLNLIGIYSAGTYTINNTSVFANYSSGGVTCNADAGTITVTSLANNKVSGTFSFSQNGGISITNGVFTDVPKQ